jgi:uracil-DNA glycosylase family protein
MSASDYLPSIRSLTLLQQAAASCRGCHLFERATQTVFGDGPSSATVMLVGEQPGNEEDLKGRAFVGPAGRLLDHALAKVGIARSETYVTNVVKHFKWEPRGKRRIHQKPDAVEIAACLPWLDAEIALVHPKVLVCLGATAAQALLGNRFHVTSERGRFVPSSLAPHVTATVHPSSILRAQTDADRSREFQRFIADLAIVADVLHAAGQPTVTPPAT